VQTAQYICYLTNYYIVTSNSAREIWRETISNFVEAKLEDFIYQVEMAKKMTTVVIHLQASNLSLITTQSDTLMKDCTSKKPWMKSLLDV